jgi:hypothetical protein
MYDSQTKLEVIRLRVEERLSFPEILSKFNIAKSTLSLWLKDYPLTEKELRLRKHALRKGSLVDLGSTVYGSWSTRPKLSKSDLGEACRQITAAKLMFKGFGVFRPLSEDTPIDLIVSTPSGRLLKCQCKCVYRLSGHAEHQMNLFSVRGSRSSKFVRHKYTAREIDVFIGYCLDNDGIYIIPYEETLGRGTLTIWVNSKTTGNTTPSSQRWLNAYDLLG